MKDGDESSPGTGPGPGPDDQERRISVAKAILGVEGPSLIIPDTLCKKKDALGDLIRALLKVQHIEPGRITCTFTVNPSFTASLSLSLSQSIDVIFFFLGGLNSEFHWVLLSHDEFSFELM